MRGSYGVNIPWNKGTFTENMVYEPMFMAHELRLLWHTNLDFFAIWAVFIGGGGGLQYIGCWSFNWVSNRTVLGQPPPRPPSRARTKRLPLEELWGGCLVSWVPKWETTENWQFHSLEPYMKPCLDTSWCKSPSVSRPLQASLSLNLGDAKGCKWGRTRNFLHPYIHVY